MPILAFDTSPVVRLLIQERGWHAVQRLVSHAQVDIVLPGPVLAEVITKVRERGNVTPPAQLRASLEAVGMTIEPANADDLQRAGELLIMSNANPETRSRAGKPTRTITLSLGDALALAVTERLGVPILTGDHHWTWLANQGLLKVNIQQM